MAHSYCNNLIHLVFSTKERRRLLKPEDLPKLSRFITGIAKNHGMSALAVGGAEDHVHALVVLPPTVALAKGVQLLKANSSRWMSERGRRLSWQEGYGAFSVSASQRDRVARYILNQAEHHKKRSFEQEFLELLKKSGVNYDPRFVFG